MARLFITPRELDFISDINKEIVKDVIGQKVSILLNLAPRKIRGVESQGMILMAESTEGDLAFVAPTKDDIETEIP